MISTQVDARKWAEEGPHQRQFDKDCTFDEERPITIFSEDNGDELPEEVLVAATYKQLATTTGSTTLTTTTLMQMATNDDGA